MQAQRALINIVCASGLGDRQGCVIAETTGTGPKVTAGSVVMSDTLKY